MPFLFLLVSNAHANSKRVYTIKKKLLKYIFSIFI